MQKIAETFSSCGHSFKQIKRAGNVALYKRWPHCSTEKGCHYEVVVISSQSEGESIMAGKTVRRESKELYPGTEQWGKRGWTYQTKENAMSKFSQICDLMKSVD
jgi:hypothetical protein